MCLPPAYRPLHSTRHGIPPDMDTPICAFVMFGFARQCDALCVPARRDAADDGGFPEAETICNQKEFQRRGIRRAHRRRAGRLC
jgi:hypothetical protein